MQGKPTGELLDHEYDGIREVDNPLPGWWNWLFVLTIAFSIVYWMYYHIGIGPSIHDSYQADVARYWESQLARLGWSEPTSEAIVALSSDADVMAAMASTFESNCAQCHRADLGGNVGPNLADEHWKNVKVPSDIFRAISDGIGGTSMPKWKDRFREPQIMLLAAYVASRRGSNPANAKAPEGVIIEPWASAVADDAPAGVAPGDGPRQ